MESRRYYKYLRDIISRKGTRNKGEQTSDNSEVLRRNKWQNNQFKFEKEKVEWWRDTNELHDDLKFVELRERGGEEQGLKQRSPAQMEVVLGDMHLYNS